MTLEDLNHHRNLQISLEKAQQRLQRLCEKDKDGALAVEIDDYRSSVEELRREVQASAIEVERFICSVKDPDLRLIFRLRFLRAMEWKEVADYCGKYYSARAISQRVYDWFFSQLDPDP